MHSFICILTMKKVNVYITNKMNIYNISFYIQIKYLYYLFKTSTVNSRINIEKRLMICSTICLFFFFLT